MMEPKENCEGGEGIRQSTGGQRDVQVIDYLYGEMSPERAAAFEEQLEKEPELENDVSQLRQVLDLWRKEPPAEEPAGSVTGRILSAAADSAVKRKSLWSRFWEWLAVPQRRYALGLAAAVVLVCGVVVAVYHSGTFDDPVGKRALPGERESLRGERFALAEERRRSERTRGDSRRDRSAGDKDTAGGESKEGIVAAADQLTADKKEPWEAEEGEAEKTPRKKMTALAFVDEESRKAEHAEDSLGGLARRNAQRRPAAKRRRSTKKKRRGGQKFFKGGRGKALAPSARPRPRGSLPLSGGAATVSRGMVTQSQRAAAEPPSSESNRRAAADFAEAVALQRKGRHRRAIQLFARLSRIKGFSRRYRALLLWARSEIALGHRAKAKKLLARVRRGSPSLRAEARRMQKRLRGKKAKKMPASDAE